VTGAVASDTDIAEPTPTQAPVAFSSLAIEAPVTPPASPVASPAGSPSASPVVQRDGTHTGPSSGYAGVLALAVLAIFALAVTSPLLLNARRRSR
jgi:hypothetical protein